MLFCAVMCFEFEIQLAMFNSANTDMCQFVKSKLCLFLHHMPVLVMWLLVGQDL